MVQIIYGHAVDEIPEGQELCSAEHSPHTSSFTHKNYCLAL